MSGRRFTWLCLLMLATMISASVAVAFLADPLRESPLSILLVTRGDSAYQESLAHGAQQAAREHGVELEIRSLHGASSQGLAESIASAVVKGISGAVVAQAGKASTMTKVQELANVSHVVTCGAEVALEEQLCHVGTGDYSAGRICSNLVREAMPDGGRILILVDDVYRGKSADRLAGFNEGMRPYTVSGGERGGLRRYSVVECVADGGKPALRAHRLKLALAKHPSIACVVDLAASSDTARMTTLASAVRERAMKFVTFDQSDAALAAVEAGEAYAVIRDNPFMQGYVAIERLSKLLRGDAMGLPARGHGYIHVPATVVRKENLDDFRSKMQVAFRAPAA